MSLLVKYRPPTVAEFVGAEVRDRVRKLMRRHHQAVSAGDDTWRRLRILITGNKGTGKTNLNRLMVKSHLCAAGDDGCCCGTCQTCLAFEGQFDSGGGEFQTPMIPSRAPATQEPDLYRFKLYDFTRTSAEQIEGIIREIAPARAFQPLFIERHLLAVTIDEVHRADPRLREKLLTTLHGKLASSVILCLASDYLDGIDPALRRRLHRIDIGRPEIGELRTFVEQVVEKESIRIGSKAALEDLVDGVDLIPSYALSMLECALLDDAVITPGWVEKTLPLVFPNEQLDQQGEG